MKSDRGTRREHLQRKQRKKPTPLWLQRGLRLGGAALVLALLVGAPIWYWNSGKGPARLEIIEQAALAHTAQAGLSADNIFVTGRSETAAADVTLALGLSKAQPLLAFDPQTARSQLEKLTWVKEANVERRFPNTVFVNLTERQPIGFFQRDGKLALVDDSATILAIDNLSRWAGLPVLVGEGAPQAASALIEQLKAHPEIFGRIKALTYLNQRRWNVRLTNNIDILLPERDVSAALDRLENAHIEGKLLDKDIQSVDLRQGDRMIVSPTRAAAARRAAPKEGI